MQDPMMLSPDATFTALHALARYAEYWTSGVYVPAYAIDNADKAKDAMRELARPHKLPIWPWLNVPRRHALIPTTNGAAQ